VIAEVLANVLAGLWFSESRAAREMRHAQAFGRIAEKCAESLDLRCDAP